MSIPWKPVVCALAISLVLACGIFGGGPEPTTAPVLVSSNILTPTPTVESQGTSDRPEEIIIEPTPQPTYTPYPTATPYPSPPPTFTPLPTYTPVPTVTPVASATPLPTYTPYPTASPYPTPQPTFTPLPTFTPEPTPMVSPTPEPTATPEPTSTPTSVPPPTPVATSTPWATIPTPVPRVARSWDHPDVWGNRKAALAASQQGFIDICDSDAPLEDGMYVLGVGNITLTSGSAPPADMSTDFVTLRNYFRDPLRIPSDSTHIQAVCIVLPPHVEARLWDSTAKRSLFTASSRRNVFSWRTDFKYSDKYIQARCIEPNCGQEESTSESTTRVVRPTDDESVRLSAYIVYLHRWSTTQSLMNEYWIAAQEAKTAENERLLREIRVNWLDWMDRVDRGHPVYEVETDDLSRQCERAETLAAELDALEATGYREWFDVCQEP